LKRAIGGVIGKIAIGGVIGKRAKRKKSLGKELGKRAVLYIIQAFRGSFPQPKN
jgi:hypothetical protein